MAKLRKSNKQGSTNKFAGTASVKFWQNASGRLFNLTRDMSLFDHETRLLLLFSAIVVVLGMIWQTVLGVPAEQGTIFAANLGGVFFFTWLIAREVDPDRMFAACVSGCIAVLASLIWGLGDIAVLFWAMMMLRLLVRTTGLSAGLLDNIVIIAVTYWIARGGFWVYPLFTAGVYILESRLYRGSPRSLYPAALAFWIATMVPKLPINTNNNISGDMFIFMIISTILFLPVVRMGSFVTSVGEYDKITLNANRLQIGQIFTVVVSFLMTWFYGDAALVSLLPIWSVACGCGIYLIFYLVKLRKQNIN